MLAVENISYRHAFTDQWAIENISFQLSSGEGLLICGPSGGGKSTLLSVLAGLAPHYFKGELKGLVNLDGESPASMSLRDWGFRAGLMMQNPEAQFLAGTVAEEIKLSLRCRQIPDDAAKELTASQLEKFGLAAIKDQTVFQLSEGQKQKVVLAALTALKPRLLLLDEPSANLDPASIVELGKILVQLKKEGLTMVIADHRLAWLCKICEQTLILQNGKAAAQGSWSLLDDDELRHIYSLRPNISKFLSEDNSVIDESHELGPSICLEKVCFAYRDHPEIISDLSAEIRCGQVTVLTGRSGRGKTTLAKILCGLEKPTSGHISFNKMPEAGHQETQVVLQNADHQLYMSSVQAEVELSLSHSGSSRKTIMDRALSILADFGLQGLGARHPQSLSGGEKQRLVVAAALAAPTRLLVLDEPTSGLDGRNLILMANQIRNLAQKGLAVLVITHDHELARMCGDVFFDLDSSMKTGSYL